MGIILLFFFLFVRAERSAASRDGGVRDDMYRARADMLAHSETRIAYGTF